jgi:small-conductance mechanosensitive channel
MMTLGELLQLLSDKGLYKYLIPITIIVATYYLTIMVQDKIIKRINSSKENKNFWQNVLLESIKNIKKLFILSFAIFFGLLWIEIPVHLKPIIHKTFTIIMILQMGQIAVLTIKMWLSQQLRANGDQDKITTINLISIISRVAVYSLVFLLILNNLGIDITALITGLGIGGIAIALAVQNILSDLFSSLTIILDKPFKVGDSIVVDGLTGTVEHIGLKTTRLRSISGEQLVIGNSDILKSRIQNFKIMENRRVLQMLTVVYQTPVDVLEKIPLWIQEIIEQSSSARFERCHLLRFLDSSLEFELVYWVNAADYLSYANLAHKINLAILKKFQQERVEFAYPTRTLFMSTSS